MPRSACSSVRRAVTRPHTSLGVFKRVPAVERRRALSRVQKTLHLLDGAGSFLNGKTLPCETEVVSRASNFVREFKEARGFKDGWYYRLADGYPWIGPFVTEHIADHARAHVTSNIRDAWSEPPWLQISTSVALGRLFLTPPRSALAFKRATLSPHTIPTSLPLQANSYQVRPRHTLAARQETPAGRDTRDTRTAPEPVIVPRRRGSRTA